MEYIAKKKKTMILLKKSIHTDLKYMMKMVIFLRIAESNYTIQLMIQN
nr:MAG TPA: hypothetical protein [Caudoviricetes sp.]